MNGENLILNLRTWRGNGYMKLNIIEEKFINISGKLQEGISTRLVSEYENSDKMIMEINHKIQMDETIKHYERSGVDNMETSKNTILYGPPGTGKTYSVIERAVQLINPLKYEDLVDSENKRTYLVEEYKKLVREKQIQFCTFHQSYSYEEFIEGLRSDEDGKFVPTNGIFKDLCERATFGYLSIKKDCEEKSIKIFKMNVSSYLWNQCEENNYIKLDKENRLDFSNINSKGDISAIINAQSNTALKDKATQYVNRFINLASIGDYIFASIDGESIVGIGKIESEYYYEKDSNFPHTRKVKWLAIWNERETSLGLPSDKRAIAEIPFEKDPELYEAILPSELFKEKKYLIIIDEINRGNISKIFGELITLIEEDKRLGEENEIKVTLPYSREPFSIPPNIYILGTMNTADRSIMLMDTALRRRFDFIEMLPAPEILDSDVEGVNVKRLLETVNKRIEFLFDRDHQIGHAYFVNKTTATEIIDVIKNKVLPLLQEYFYGDWEKIELILGGAAAIGNNDYFIQKEDVLAKSIFKSKIRRLPDQHVKYSIVDSPSTQALINIYE